MRGRKPKPTDQKQAKGTLRESRVFEDEIKFDLVEDRIEAPICLGINGQAEWNRIVPQLQSRGVLSEVDYTNLTAYCMEVDGYFDAKKTLQDEGKYVTVTTKSGKYKVAHPAISVANNCLKNFLKIATEYGFTASSRTRISVGKAKADPEKDKFLKLVANK